MITTSLRRACLVVALPLLLGRAQLSGAASHPESLADQRTWQIQGGHNGDSGNFTMLAGMARHGMNSIFVSMGGT